MELHRFYKDESTFCHASGTKEEVRLASCAVCNQRIIGKLASSSFNGSKGLPKSYCSVDLDLCPVAYR